MLNPELNELWEAVQRRDKSYEGRFVFAVTSTKVFCKPGCGSRTPRRENVQFFTATQDAVAAGFRPCLRCHPNAPSDTLIPAICDFIAENLEGDTSLASLSQRFDLTPSHLQRRFKAALGITPRQYAQQEKLSRFKKTVKHSSVTAAIYDSGFGSSSRLYESSQLGMDPTTYQKGGLSESITYATQQSPIGLMLVAVTVRGICSIQFADDETALVENLRAEFPSAQIAAGAIPGWEALAGWLPGQEIPASLPLDIRATAFQRRVWDYLRSIPTGTTRTYNQIAADLGAPNSTRAVARACATNRIALLIPCHRVIHKDGTLAGYRWGVNRKEALLKAELSQAKSKPTHFPS